MIHSSSFSGRSLSFTMQFVSVRAMQRTGLFVITGSGSGIGQAIAELLMQKGHSVIGVGRSLEKLRALQLKWPKQFYPCAQDLTHPGSAPAIVDCVTALKNQLSLPLLGLVNNAGIFVRQSFLETTDATWEEQFQNNLLSAVRLTRALEPHLKAAAPSSVLNVSSSVTERMVPQTSAYSAMKAAMNVWTKVLALEWAPLQIRVNAICPGLVDTPIHGFHTLPDTDALRQQVHQMQPLGRLGQAGDIASAAWFLLGDESSWTTGSLLTVDGGISL